MKTKFICVQSAHIPPTTDIDSFFERLDKWGNVELENK